MPKTIPVALVTNAEGSHLDQYLTSLAAIEEADPIALLDPSGVIEARARKALGMKLRGVYKEAGEMYQKFAPALALVTLEARLTPAAIDAALEANCHVLAEKPACVRAADFAPLVAKAQRKHRHLMLALANRSHAPMQEARRIVRKGALGRLYGVEIHLIADQTRLTREAYRRSWQCSKARAGGGHLAWLGIHWLDLCQFITGLRVEAVAGFTGVVGGQPIDVEDSAVVSLKFNDRCFGTMTSGYYLDKGYHSHMQIWGEHGWLKVSAIEDEPLRWYTTKDVKEPRVQEFAYPRGQRGYTPFVRSCIRAAAGLEDAPISGEECLSVLQTIFTFYEAARSERVQKLG
jgi:predicted dehydrogenase